MTIIQNNYIVYKHVSPSRKIYIGITSTTPEKRWANGKGYRHNEYFSKAINKYGWKNFDHYILCMGLSKIEAENKERELISLYRSNEKQYGYNLSNGGECIGKHSAESRKKMSMAKIGKPSARKGVKLSEETKKKISEKHKGLRYNIGVPFTEERKRHLSENHADFRGEKNPSYGKKWTPEQIAIRQAHRIYKRGGDNPTSKPILQLDLDGNLIKRWNSITEACEIYTRTSIKDCLRGKYKQHRGYQWRYADNG